MTRPQVPEGTRRCSKCGEEKTTDEFYDSVPTRCIKCVREYQRQWYFKTRTLKRPQLPEGMRRCSTCHEIKPEDQFYRDRSNVSGYAHRCKVCSDELRNARRRREQEARNALKEVLPEGYKRCTKCDRVLALEEFNKYRKNSEERRQPCKECAREYRRQSHVKRQEAEYKKQPDVRERRNRLRRRRRRTNEDLRAREKAYRQEYQKRDYVVEKSKQQHAEYRACPENRRKARRVTREWMRNNREQCRLYGQQRYARKKGAEGTHTCEQWDKLLELCDYKCLDCGTTEDLTRDHIRPLKFGGSNYIDNIQVLCHHCNVVKREVTIVDYRPRHVRKWAHGELEGVELAEAA